MQRAKWVLDFDVEHLASAIHSIRWVDAVWTVECAVLSIFSELRKRKLNGTTALAAALLRLFAFWLSHGMKWMKFTEFESLFS